MANGEHDPLTRQLGIVATCLGMLASAVGIFRGRKVDAPAVAVVVPPLRTETDLLIALEQRFENRFLLLEQSQLADRQAAEHRHEEMLRSLEALRPGTPHS